MYNRLVSWGRGRGETDKIDINNLILVERSQFLFPRFPSDLSPRFHKLRMSPDPFHHLKFPFLCLYHTVPRILEADLLYVQNGHQLKEGNTRFVPRGHVISLKFSAYLLNLAFEFRRVEVVIDEFLATLLPVVWHNKMELKTKRDQTMCAVIKRRTAVRHII